MMKFLIGCDIEQNGLKVLYLNSKNYKYIIKDLDIKYVSYICTYKKNIYALTDINYEYDKNGAYLNIIKNDISEKLLLNSQNPCYITNKKNMIAISNFSSNFVILYNIKNKKIKKLYLKESSSIHCSIFYKNGLMIIDYINGEILFVDKKIKSIYKFKNDERPRHGIIKNNYLYLICENSCNLYTFKIENNYSLKLCDVKNYKFNNACTGCAIKYIGSDRLVVTIRGINKILFFDISNFIPELRSINSTHGICPRDFEVKNNLIIITNTESNSLSIFKIKSKFYLEYLLEINDIKLPCCIMG